MNTEEAATVLQIASTLDESEDKNLMTVATILRGMLGEIQRLGTESDKLRADLAARDAEIADLKRGGVVVPDITDEDFESISVLTHETGIGCHDSDNDSFRLIVASTWAYAQGAFVDISRLRPISADRVLGAGKVAVDREELCLLRQLESGWREPYDLSAGERARIITRLDALRAQPTQEPAT